MITRLAFVVAMVSLSTAARSQPATDNEIYAAYCQGTFNFRITQFQHAPAYSPRDMEMRNKNLVELYQKKKRFDDYLVATGADLNPARGVDPWTLVISTKRGESDESDCVTGFLQCAAGMVCHVHKKDDPFDVRPLTNDELKCVAAKTEICRNEVPACTRAGRCERSDALPF